MNDVKYWTTRNDANYNNRHAEALGVEFFAFPHQSLYARHGNRGAMVADILVNGENGVESLFSATRTTSLPNGKVERLEQRRFNTQDEAILWAAEWVKQGCVTSSPQRN